MAAQHQTFPTAAQVLDGLPDGVVGASEDGTVRVVNRVAARMFGARRRDLLGRPLDEVLELRGQHGERWVEVNSPFQGLRIRTGVPEQSWLLPDGQEVLTRAQLHRDRPLGEVTAVMVTLRNGRGRARLDRERSDLVATVAHELRSPLTGVKGFVQALLNRWDRLEDNQRKLMLHTVHADSERLSRLITELLDVARLDTGRLSLYPRPVDAVVLAERVVASVGQGTAREIALVTVDPVPELLADPDKFTQILTNLVENGVRHGDGTVRVGLGPDPEQPDRVRITVDDEGLGIAPDLRRRAFTKFWTAGTSGGSGLGLYIVNGLVRAHGGELEITDSASGGARVVLHWPVPRDA